MSNWSQESWAYNEFMNGKPEFDTSKWLTDCWKMALDKAENKLALQRKEGEGLMLGTIKVRPHVWYAIEAALISHGYVTEGQYPILNLKHIGIEIEYSKETEAFLKGMP